MIIFIFLLIKRKKSISQIEILLGQKIDIEKTVIFFDEIQICERAITSLKYFCEAKENQVIPIEVKAGEHIKSRSMSNYIIKYKPPYVIRISAGNFGFSNNIFSIPLYAIFCLGVS